jgi:hypothetical protein
MWVSAANRRRAILLSRGSKLCKQTVVLLSLLFVLWLRP